MLSIREFLAGQAGSAAVSKTACQNSPPVSWNGLQIGSGRLAGGGDHA